MHDDVLTPLLPAMNAGQQEHAATLRRIIQLVSPELYGLLSTCESDPFLEPLAFLHFATGAPGAGLAQIFAGHLAQAHHALQLPVATDGSGRCYIPRVGFLQTATRDARLILAIGAEPGDLALLHGDDPIPFRVEPPHIVAGTAMELCRHPIPLLDHCFTDPAGQAVAVEITDPAHAHADDLADACAMLRELWPALFDAIASVVRLVVIFRSETLNSFAAPAAHGAIFLNAALGDNAVFFLEDLAHQGGHALFSAASGDGGAYFTVPPTTPMRALGGAATDTRSIYVVLHGVFTEALMSSCLDRCLTGAICADARSHEVQGRLAFIMQRFAADLRNITQTDGLSAEGAEFVARLSDVWRDIFARHAGIVAHADFSNQRYNFDYRAYRAANPARTAASDMGTPPILASSAPA
jgi:hypothetical protein